MNPLQQNLDALRARNPDLASRIDSVQRSAEVRPEQADSGAFTFRVGERLEASLEEPEAEGREQLARFLAEAERAGAQRLVIFARHAGRRPSQLLGVLAQRFLPLAQVRRAPVL